MNSHRNKSPQKLFSSIQELLGKHNILDNGEREQLANEILLEVNKHANLQEENNTPTLESAQVELLEALPANTIIIDNNGIILYANNAFRKLASITNETILPSTAIKNLFSSESPYSISEVLKGKAEVPQKIAAKLVAGNKQLSVTVEITRHGTNLFLCTILDQSQLNTIQHTLGERIKELNCLLDISEICSHSEQNPASAYQQITDRIPSSFQFPHLTSVSISIYNETFNSNGFATHPQNIKQVIENIGFIEVHISNSADDSIKGKLFLDEEKQLLKGIAKIIEQFIAAHKVASIVEQREKYYRTLLHGLHEDIMVINPSYEITDVNNNFLRNSGLTKEQVIGKHCFEISHGLSQPCHLMGGKCGLLDVFKTGEAGTCRHRHVKENGEIAHIDIILSPLKDEEGKITHVIEAARDITELVNSRKAIAESEEKYRLLITQMQQGLALHEVIKDQSGKVVDYRFIEVNRSYEKLTGLTASNIIGKTVLEVLPNTEDYWIKLFGDVATTGTPLHFDNYSRELGKHFHVDAFSPRPNQFAVIIWDITDSKKAEELLKESELRYRNIFESNHATMLIIDPDDGSIIDANAAAAKFYGWDRDTLKSMKITQINTLSTNEIIAEMQNAKNEGRKQLFFKHRLSDSSIRDVEVFSGTALVNNRTMLFSIVHDITEKKITEQALIDSEEKHRALFETMEQGVVYQDKKGHIVSANRAAQKILGLTLEQLQGRTSLDPRWKAVDEQGNELKGEMHPAMVALETGKSVPNQTMGIFHPERNDYTWILINAVPEYQNGEEKPYRVFTTFTDITDLKKAEEELQHQKEFLETLMQTIPNPIFYKNAQGYYTGCNKAFETFLGKSSKEIVGKTAFSLAPQEIAQLYHKKDMELISNPGNQTYEWQIKDSKNELRDVIFDKATIVDKQGGILGIVGVITDITERKKAELSIQQNSERLKALVRIFEFKSTNKQELLDFALNEALFLTSSKIGYIYNYNSSKQQFTLNSWSKGVLDECSVINPETCYELGNTGIWGEIVRQRKEIILNNFREQHPLKKGYPKGHAELYRYMSIPVFIDNEIVAVVGVANKDSDYNETDLHQLQFLMNSVWGIVQQNEANEKIQKLSTAVEQSPVSVVITDTNGNIEFVNPKFTQLTGYTFNEAVGKNPNILSSGYHNKQFFKQMWGTILKGEEWKGQLVNKKKNGELYWESALISPVMNKQGKIVNFIAIKEDVTELKRAEDALRDSELKLRRMIEKSPDGIMLTDEKGTIVEWNRALENLIKIPSKNARGKHIWDFHNIIPIGEGPKNAHSVFEACTELLTQGKSVRFKVNHQYEVEFRNDNKVKYGHLMAFVIPSEKGNMIASFIRDITQQKLAELAIKSSEEKLRAIFDNSIQSFIIINHNYEIEAFNEVAKTTICNFFKKEIAAGKSILEFYASHHVPTIKELIDKALRQEVAREEMSLNNVHGEQFWFELQFSPVYNEEGHVSGVFFNSMDITQRKSAEESLARALQKEKELSELKSRFVSTVSHEFRTPLASIFSNAQLLQRYYTKWDSTKREQSFSRVYESVKAMTNMLENVSLIGKEQSGKLSFRPEILNLNQLATQLVEESHLTLNESNRVDIYIDSTYDRVLLDQVLLRHIITNLITNALKYSPEKQNVKFTIKQQDRFLEFIIQDFGIGIPEEDLVHIAEPFFRASNSEEFKGTGLGMSIVKQCVSVHGGSMSIKSALGKGTTITVTLPLRKM